jgi:sugar lactone lactonase YvrE
LLPAGAFSSAVRAGWSAAPQLGYANAGPEWPKNEHGIHVDGEGNVWVGGNDKDDQILKLTPDGKLLLQVGKPDTPGGSNSTTRLGRPAHMVTDDAAGELFVADGYWQSAHRSV